jgi:hypothetical protein
VAIALDAEVDVTVDAAAGRHGRVGPVTTLIPRGRRPRDGDGLVCGPEA